MPERPWEREPSPTPEDEGLPDLQDGSPEAEWAEDPQEMPLPGDEPVAAEEYGVTAEEQREGEPLDLRLEREEADVAPEPEPSEEPDRAAGRIVEADEGVRTDAEADAVAAEAGEDVAGRSPEERAMRVEPE